MKKMLMIIVSILLLQLSAKSQFVLTALVDSIPTDSIEFCIGDTLDLDAIKTDYLMNNNFDNGSIGAGWSTNVTALWSNPCSPTSLPSSGVVLWFGSNIYPRELQTINYDIHCYRDCFIEWDMKYGANQNSTDCESPDEPTEGVHLEWSINGGATWTQFVGESQPIGVYGSPGYINGTGGYWTPVPGNAATGPYYTWNHYKTKLPLTAISFNTKFRWYQTLASGNTWDHWGIDNVQISCPTQLFVQWTCLELPFWSWYTMNPPPITLVNPGVYHYVVTIVDLLNNNQCVQADTVVVNVRKPIVYINDSTSYISSCYGDSVKLVSYGYGLYNYNWNTTPVIYNDTIIVNPDTTTYFIVNAKDSLGCLAKDTIKIVVNPIPIVNLNNDTICVGDTAVLSVSGGYSYLWQLNNSSSNILKVKPLLNTFYPVKVTSDSGCFKIDTSYVFVNNLPSLQLSNKTICSGDTTTLKVIGGNYYKWNTSDTTSDIKIWPTKNTTYSVIVTDTNYCTDSIKSLVEVIEKPIPNITKNIDTVCKGNPIMLTASGGSLYHWSTNDVTPSIIFYPMYSNIYYVDIYNTLNGVNCVSNTSIFVDVINCDVIYIPNSFAPFGQNKIFKPISMSKVYKSYKLLIYNRWGELIFETNNVEIGWDGKYKGNYVSAGSYVYYIEYNNSGSIFTKIGSITVIF